MTILRPRRILTRVVNHLHWRRDRARRSVSITATRWARRTVPISTFTYPLGEHGRLGNQLFEIAGTIGIAASLETRALFPAKWQYRKYYSIPDDFYTGSLTIARCDQAWKRATIIDEVARVFLQDLRLWNACRKEIHEWLQPSELAREAATTKFSELLALPSKSSLHVRRGDYVTGPSHGVCPTSYYEQSVALIQTDDPSTEFLVFSDDIDWCRENIGISGAHYISGNPDWLDMALMAQCQHHICANSTFSWWGAFLSADPSPIVPWLTGVLPSAFRMRQPDGWREVEIAPDRTLKLN